MSVKPHWLATAVTFAAWPAPSSASSQPPRASKRLDSGKDSSIGGKSLNSAVQRKPGIEVANLARQPCKVSCRNIGRVRDDKVKPSFNASRPVANSNLGPGRQTARLKIVLRDLCRIGGHIDANAARAAEFGQQSAQQRAGANAKVEDTQRVLTAIAQNRERGFDDRFRFRSRIQHMGRNGEREAPEFALADDPGQGFSDRSPRGGFLNLPRRRPERLARVDNQRDRREP